MLAHTFLPIILTPEATLGALIVGHVYISHCVRAFGSVVGSYLFLLWKSDILSTELSIWVSQYFRNLVRESPFVVQAQNKFPFS